MRTRKEKVSWLKSIFSGKADNTKPLKTDTVCLYPGTRQAFYFFVDGKSVSFSDYKKAHEQNEKNFGRPEVSANKGGIFGRLYMGDTPSGIPDELPEYFGEVMPLESVFSCLLENHEPDDLEFLTGIRENRRTLSACTTEEVERLKAIQLKRAKHEAR